MNSAAPRVLLVDDDSDIVELLEYNLIKEGYEVLGLTNPLQVTEALSKFTPQLLVMDIMMPGVNGFQLCSSIRNTKNGNDLTIFFMTMGEEGLKKPALQSGADDFIQKFSGLRVLINRINLVVKKRMIIRKRLNTVTVGKWKLNRENLSALNQSREIKLSNLEFDLFYFLAQNARRAIPIKLLNSVINSSDVFNKKFSVVQCLEMLAKKIGEGLIVFTSEHRVKFNC